MLSHNAILASLFVPTVSSSLGRLGIQQTAAKQKREQHPRVFVLVMERDYKTKQLC